MQPLSSKSKFLLYTLAYALLGAVLFAYWNHFNNPFHFDDDHTIVSNYWIKDIHNIPRFFTDATTTSSLPANQAYRPGLTTLNAIDYWIGGKPEPTPFYYHLHIFISFLLLGVCLYFFFLKIFNAALDQPFNPYLALLSVAVFMLHTANAETINYIISRSDSQSTLFIIVAILVVQYFPTWRKWQLYLFPMFIAFMIKEPGVLVGPLVFLYLFFFEEQASLADAFTTRKWLRPFFYVLPALLLAAVLFAFAQSKTPATWTSGGYDRWSYLKTETFVMVHYVNNFLFPFNLSADTDWGLITQPFDDRAVIGTVFVLFTVYLAWKASLQRTWRPVSYGILWFYLTLLPTSSFFPFSEVLNDHRVFLPYIGLTMAFVWSIYLGFQKITATKQNTTLWRNGALLLTFVFLAVHIYGIRQRVAVWSTGESLWRDVSIKSPKNGRGLMNYGNALMARGNYDSAQLYFDRAKIEWPYYSYIYVNLGVLHAAKGNFKEAESNYRYAMQLNNGNPNAYYYYAQMLKKAGRYAEAKAQVDLGLTKSPQHIYLTMLRNELQGPMYANSVADRLAGMEKLCKEQPTADNFINLSLEYYNNGRYLDCVKASEEALKINPKYAAAYNNICSAYNMLKEWDKAIDAGQKGLAIDPGFQLLKNNLAASIKAKQSGQ
ncbi:MAG: tetratricopeptide repeat protein [Chitinophagales bacterium]